MVTIQVLANYFEYGLLKLIALRVEGGEIKLFARRFKCLRKLGFKQLPQLINFRCPVASDRLGYFLGLWFVHPDVERHGDICP